MTGKMNLVADIIKAAQVKTEAGRMCWEFADDDKESQRVSTHLEEWSLTLDCGEDESRVEIDHPESVTSVLYTLSIQNCEGRMMSKITGVWEDLAALYEAARAAAVEQHEREDDDDLRMLLGAINELE